MNIEEEITFLTSLWYKYVSHDHHKDRDCHFFIEKVWSYGNEPYYQPHHAGYIMEKWVGPKCETELLAMTVLRDKLKNEIQSSIMSLQMDIEYLDGKGIDHEWVINKEDLLKKIEVLNGKLD